MFDVERPDRTSGVAPRSFPDAVPDRSLSRRSSYFAISRAPRYSVLFALPLLLGYEGLAALLAHPGRELRNGADVLLREAFSASPAGTVGRSSWLR